jgi:5-methylcytosine-specific restriction protein A
MSESYQELYSKLRESAFGCVPPGFHETQEVYDLVESEHSALCDDSIQCGDVCGTDKSQPEWKHRVRTLQQDLGGNDGSRVNNLSKGWYYAPRTLDIDPVPDEADQLSTGSKYNRWELHDVFGGQRYSGISTPSEHPVVFMFTGESGEEYGYEDEFLDDDTFLYTGEGASGDMEMTGGNRAIRNHQENGADLHLFENTAHPWIVTYLGEFEYVQHHWETLEDETDRQRRAIRFRLAPAGGIEVEIEKGSPASLSMEELYEKGKQGSESNATASSSGGRSYKRSAVVREFALRAANGVCQGCGEDAPFIDNSGEPFLEVHHLHRRSDGGPDDPENVIAVCPNCHRRVHHGRDGDELNRELIERADARNAQFS